MAKLTRTLPIKMCNFMLKSHDYLFVKQKLYKNMLHIKYHCQCPKYKYSKRYCTNNVSIKYQESLDRPTVQISLHSRMYSTYLTPSPSVSLSHVKRILNMKKMEVKDGYTCLATRCIFCIHENNFEGHLFINKVTGYFICTKCKASGSWDSLEKALKKNDSISFLPVEDISEPPAKWATINEKSESIKSLPPDKIKEVMDQFHFKGVIQDQFIDLNPMVNQSRSHIYVPVTSGANIVGVKELTPDGRETTVPNVGCRGLLVIRACQMQKREAVIVHSVRDMLALGSWKLQSDIISLPHGIMNLPQEVLPLLEDYSKITLWFGNDDSHWESARQFAKKLNEQRCYFVRPTEEHPAPHKAQLKGLNLATIVESAMPIAHKSITQFSLMREDILSHLQNTDKAAGVKWVRFPALNNILKGHRRGEMTILTGPSGAGKTTFMSEYSLDLAMQGVTTLWGSFEIRNERLARTMLQQLCRFPLHLQLDQFNKWADIFQLLPIYFLTFFGQQPLKVVMEAVQHAAYVHDIAHVVIDNVQFMMGQSENENSLDRFYRQDAIIGTFRNFASTANCHVTLVIHPRKERDAELLSMNSVFGGAKATQEADNVLIIQQKALQNLKIKKYLQVAKNRYSGDLGMMPLDFYKEGLSYAQKSVKNERFTEDTLDQDLVSYL